MQALLGAIYRALALTVMDHPSVSAFQPTQTVYFHISRRLLKTLPPSSGLIIFGNTSVENSVLKEDSEKRRFGSGIHIRVNY